MKDMLSEINKFLIYIISKGLLLSDTVSYPEWSHPYHIPPALVL
jgi:hypothetical protein